MKETYKMARARLLQELAAKGWKTKPTLVKPQAISPDNTVQLFFHPQAVYKGELSMWVDIRGMHVDRFIELTGYRPI